ELTKISLKNTWVNVANMMKKVENVDRKEEENNFFDLLAAMRENGPSKLADLFDCVYEIFAVHCYESTARRGRLPTDEMTRIARCLFFAL
ncbi:hypothetical protein PMAYCL1PPCAC_20723, partial [Pristionchus mayeri]